jgi:hypothetical protein
LHSAILSYDERRARELLTLYGPLARQDRDARAKFDEAERRLAMIGEMRALYDDLRGEAAPRVRLASPSDCLTATIAVAHARYVITGAAGRVPLEASPLLLPRERMGVKRRAVLPAGHRVGGERQPSGGQRIAPRRR